MAEGAGDRSGVTSGMEGDGALLCGGEAARRLRRRTTNFDGRALPLALRPPPPPHGSTFLHSQASGSRPALSTSTIRCCAFRDDETTRSALDRSPDGSRLSRDPFAPKRSGAPNRACLLPIRAPIIPGLTAMDPATSSPHRLARRSLSEPGPLAESVAASAPRAPAAAAPTVHPAAAGRCPFFASSEEPAAAAAAAAAGPSSPRPSACPFASPTTAAGPSPPEASWAPQQQQQQKQQRPPPPPAAA